MFSACLFVCVCMFTCVCAMHAVCVRVCCRKHFSVGFCSNSLVWCFSRTMLLSSLTILGSFQTQCTLGSGIFSRHLLHRHHAPVKLARWRLYGAVNCVCVLHTCPATDVWLDWHWAWDDGGDCYHWGGWSLWLELGSCLGDCLPHVGLSFELWKCCIVRVPRIHAVNRCTGCRFSSRLGRVPLLASLVLTPFLFFHFLLPFFPLAFSALTRLVGDRKGIRPVKTDWWGAGVVIRLERGADLHLMPLPLTVSCFSKIQIGFTFLVLAHTGSPGQRAVKWVCTLCPNWNDTKIKIYINRIVLQSLISF